MTVRDWSTTTSTALLDAWVRTVGFIPRLLGAIVILIIGVLIANILRWVVERIIEASRLQTAFDQLHFTQSLKGAKMNTQLSTIVGVFVQWVVIILFMMPAASILGLSQVSAILDSIIRYLPNVGIAIIIFFLGALFADFIGNVVRATAAGLGSHGAYSLSTLSRYIIYVFTALAALSQLGIAPQVINILLTGLVAAAAIASGLSFGLGGKDAAADLIAKVRRDFGPSSK